MGFSFQFASLVLQSEPEAVEFDPTILLVSTAILLVISIGVGYWVYKDASKRDNNELLWAIGITALLFFTFLFGLVALIAYFVLRGDVVEQEPAGTEVAGDSWETDATQTDADDTDW